MSDVGGNTTAVIQVSTTIKNAIGSGVKAWEDVQTLTGWLDLSGGDSKYNTYSAKIQESSHIFLADYEPLDSRIKADNSRLVINGERYDVMVIDDPMGLHKHLEIYLKYTGGQ